MTVRYMPIVLAMCLAVSAGNAWDGPVVEPEATRVDEHGLKGQRDASPSSGPSYQPISAVQRVLTTHLFVERVVDAKPELHRLSTEPETP